MSYDPNTFVNATNPLPIKSGTGYDPAVYVTSSNPLPITFK